jgi:hypothetical protein
MKFTFDVTKCDKLFDLQLQNNIIRLKGGHVIPTVEQLARKKYCKWHDSFSHTTNEYNYFRRQIQSALNDGQLTLGDNHQMKLDVDPFPVDMINFEEKRVLVCMDQADTAKGKNVVVPDEPRARMMKPKNPEAGICKKNMQRKARSNWRPGWRPVRRVNPIPPPDVGGADYGQPLTAACRFTCRHETKVAIRSARP